MAKVLVVDDDRDLCEGLAAMLEMEGYDVARAANGREALEYLRKHPKPCVILLDLMMPVMDGWEFSEEKRRIPELASIPVVVVTAAGGEVRRRGDSIPAIAYIEKPFDIDRLLATVQEACA